MGLFSRNNATALTPADPSETPVELPKTDESLDRPRMAAPIRPSIVAPPPPSERQIYIAQMKVRIHQQLVERLDMQGMRSMPPDVVRQEVRTLIRELCQNEKSLLSSAEQERRERSRKHRQAVMTAVKKAIMAAGPIDEAQAVNIVKALVGDKVPHTKVAF